MHLFIISHDVSISNNQIEGKSQIELDHFEFKNSANLSIEDLSLEIKAEGTKEVAIF